MKNYKLAVVGATGVVGQKMIEVLLLILVYPYIIYLM